MTTFTSGHGSTPILLATAAGAAAVGAASAQQPSVAIAIIGLAATAVAVLAWPDVATHAVLFLTYVSAAAVAVKFHGAPLAIGLVIPLLLIVPVAHHLVRGEPLLFPTPFLLMLTLLLVQIASTAISLDIDTGWERVKTFAFEGVLMYFLLVNAIRSTATLMRATWVLLASGAALSAVSLFQRATGNYSKPFGGFAQVGRDYFTGHSAEARLAGPLGDPNYYAQILLVVAPLGLLLAWSERSPLRRAAAFAATALAVSAVSLTASRGAAVAFLLILVLMRILGYLRGPHLALIAAGLVVLLMVVPAYRDRVATLTGVAGATGEPSRHDSGADQSVRSRSTEMMAAALVLTDHPILGVGPDQFPLYYQAYANRVGGEVRDKISSGVRKGELPQREAHNMLLGVAADLGLAGLAVLLALIYVTLRDLLRLRQRRPGEDPALAHIATGLMLGFVAYLVTGLFLTLAFERYFWLVLALCGAAATVAARERGLERTPRGVSAPTGRAIRA